MKIPLDKPLAICYNNYTETVRETEMSYDPKNYPKSQKDAFENELKDHDLTLEELIEATKNGYFMTEANVPRYLNDVSDRRRYLDSMDPGLED